ncbi:hypothetical protein [Kalamiella sp. sgz302252]|uniref:hypothetical protein n=1 Tax=Pantoea sp. sgz302252 TaxID=3341827 RepID=UPI0036D291D2
MKIINLFYLTLLLSLSSCALSEDFSPPPDGKTVKVAVVRPVDIDILPMDIIYRSEKCRDKIFTSAGAISSRAGYHLLTVPFKPEAGSDIVSNSVALDGGGRCEWKISNIKLEFEYSYMKKFGSYIQRNIPSDVVFIFDNNAPPRGNGHYEEVHGALIVNKDYFPLIRKSNINEGEYILSIKGQSMLTYRVYNTSEISFIPLVHSDMLVNAFPPEKKGDGYLLIYPNGEKLIDHHFPNSEKTKYEFVKQRARQN